MKMMKMQVHVGASFESFEESVDPTSALDFAENSLLLDDLELDLDLVPEFGEQEHEVLGGIKKKFIFPRYPSEEPCSKRCRTNETRFVGTAGYDLSNQKEERTSYSYEESAPTTSRMKRKHNATSSSTNCDIFTGADTPPGISNLLLSQSKPEFLEIQIQHMSTRLADSMERSASSRKLVNNEAAKLSSSAAGWKCPNSSSLLHESGMQIALFMSNISSKTF